MNLKPLPAYHFQPVHILLLIFQLVCSGLFAQADTVKMGEVLIKPASKRELPAYIIESISATGLRGSAHSIEEVLKLSPSLDIRQRGPFGIQTDLGVLGGSFDQTMVLLNGINITDPQTGHNNLSLPVDISAIEGIDILTGASTGIYGSGGLAGAVNIITNGKAPNIRASLTLGAHELTRVSLSASDSSGRISHTFNFSAASSGGYRRNTDFSDKKIFLRTEYSHRKGVSDIQAGLTSRDFGANSFYSLRFPEQFEAIRTGFMSVRYQSNTRVNFVPSAYIRTNKDRFELIRNNDSIPFNHHRSTVTGFGLDISTGNTFRRSAIGLNIRDERILSNVLGNLLETSNNIYTRGYSRLITDLNAEHEITFEALTLKAGLLANYSQDHKKIGLYPSLHTKVKISEKTEINASAGKSIRLPTFTDMFYRSPVQSGNRKLDPESATLLEAGIKAGNQAVSGSATIFRRKVNNMIDWVKDLSPDSLIWRSMNHSNILFSGFRFSLIYDPQGSDGGFMSFSYSFLDAGRNSTMLSKYAFDYLRHKLTSEIDIKTVWNIHASAIITFNDRNNYYQDVSGIVKPYKPFGLCDLKLYRKSGNYTIHLEASNIFDTEYFDYGGIPQPGTWFSGGIIFKTKL